MRVFGPQHMATINGLLGTSVVSTRTKPLMSGKIKFVLIKVLLFLQLFNSVVRTVYIVLALESVGYMWTFVIFACIAAVGRLKLYSFKVT